MSTAGTSTRSFPDRLLAAARLQAICARERMGRRVGSPDMHDVTPPCLADVVVDGQAAAVRAALTVTPAGAAPREEALDPQGFDSTEAVLRQETDSERAVRQAVREQAPRLFERWDEELPSGRRALARPLWCGPVLRPLTTRRRSREAPGATVGHPDCNPTPRVIPGRFCGPGAEPPDRSGTAGDRSSGLPLTCDRPVRGRRPAASPCRRPRGRDATARTPRRRCGLPGVLAGSARLSRRTPTTGCRHPARRWVRRSSSHPGTASSSCASGTT